MKPVPLVGVVIDTSVWIDFFRGRLQPAALHAITLLLDSETAMITHVIRHELLSGATSESDYTKLDRMLSALPVLSISKDEDREFNRFGFLLAQKGFLGRYTDASIAFLARKHGLPVFAFDGYFQKLAKKRLIRCLNPG